MDAPAAPVAVFKKRGAKAKANIRKRAATPPPADSDSSDYSSSEDEAGHRIKRRRKDKSSNVTTSTKTSAAADTGLSATVFKADRSVPITDSNDATKRTNWFDAEDKDSLSTKNLLGTTRSAQPQEPPDGKYKGLANKPSFIQKNPDAPSRTVGPVKAPTNIRTITITDFAPDVCKDYKQTGFCGFGDNCKYLHAREDYKAGWQLDKEWETVTKGKKNLGGTVVASRDKSNTAAAEDDDDDEEDALIESIPFACIICKEPYKQPIKTRCGHYFCEPCALKRYRKDPTCAACGSGTNGVFNGARQLQKLLDKKRERAAKRRQAAIDAGEEVSDEEEE
ncbi:RNA-splicing factor [Pyricularia grisea]|nr:RNA-splicing factor [Pyricularia grisea]